MKAPLTNLTLGALLLTGPITLSEETGAIPGETRPTGRLDIANTYVRSGTKPLIHWEINYPTTIHDLVEFDSKDLITPSEPCVMSIRLAGLNVKNNNGHGNNLDGVDSSNTGQGSGGPGGAIDLSGDFDDEAAGAKLFVQTGQNSWQELYSGPSTEVKPAEVLFNQLVRTGETIQLASQLITEGGAVYAASSSIALTNGSPLPSTELKSYLTPFLSKENTIALGPREVLFLFELNSSDPTSSEFDVQDVAVVVSFNDVPEN